VLQNKKFRHLRNFRRFGQFRAYEKILQAPSYWIKSTTVIVMKITVQVVIFARFGQNLIGWFPNALKKKKMNVFVEQKPVARAVSH